MNDVALFVGAQATFTIQRVDSGTTSWIVTDTDIVTNGNEGTDTLTNIESLRFNAPTLTTVNLADLIGALSDSDVTANTVVEGAANGTAVGITGHAVDGSVQTVTYSLTDNAGGRFQINGSSGIVTVANGSLLNTVATQAITMRATSADGSFTEKQFSINVTQGGVNAAPTAVVLQNTTTTLAENTSTALHIKVADIAVTDDGLGTKCGAEGANDGAGQDCGVSF